MSGGHSRMVSGGGFPSYHSDDDGPGYRPDPKMPGEGTEVWFTFHRMGLGEPYRWSFYLSLPKGGRALVAGHQEHEEKSAAVREAQEVAKFYGWEISFGLPAA